LELGIKEDEIYLLEEEKEWVGEIEEEELFFLNHRCENHFK